MQRDLVRSAASDALRGFILEIETKLSDVSSSQELDSFRSDLLSAAEAYGVNIDATLTKDLQSRLEVLEDREGEEDPDPYKQAGRPATDGEISDNAIKSMFSLMATDPISE